MNPLAETSIAELSSPVSDPKVLQLFAYDWDDLAKSFFIYQQLSEDLPFGTQRISIKVVDKNNPSSSTTLNYIINVIDYCKESKVSVTGLVKDIAINPRSGVFVQNLCNFEIDADHAEKCKPLVASSKFDTLNTVPTFDWRKFIDFDTDKGKLIINAGNFTQSFEVEFSMFAQVKGISDYPSASNIFVVYFVADEEKHLVDINTNLTSIKETAEKLAKYAPPVKINMQVSTPRPQAYINSISSSGEVEIKFTQAMFIPWVLKDIPDQKKQKDFTDLSYSVLELYVVPSGYEDNENLRIGNFTI